MRIEHSGSRSFTTAQRDVAQMFLNQLSRAASLRDFIHAYYDVKYKFDGCEGYNIGKGNNKSPELKYRISIELTLKQEGWEGILLSRLTLNHLYKNPEGKRSEETEDHFGERLTVRSDIRNGLLKDAIQSLTNHLREHFIISA